MARRKKTTRSITLEDAIAAFIADRDLRPSTRRGYGAAYAALRAHYGGRARVSSIKVAGLRSVLRRHWTDAAPSTWNVRVAALQSLCSYCHRQGWLKSNPAERLERRRCLRDDSRAIAYEDLEALWSSKAHALRERLLWRLLYATAARAAEVLALNIEDLDLGRKRAVVTGKGGHRETIVWDAGAARLLQHYIAGRPRGPLFVTSRAPNVVPAATDRAPDGCARLSYQRAWALFREASDGRWSLHQIRHSTLTHLGERGVAAPLLMAKSRHQDLRTMARYVRPGVEAVARLTAENDPERRRRR